MFTVTKYPHGTFSWVDCASTDPENGREFYAKLMGWTTDLIPMGDGEFYTMFRQDGHAVAGMGRAQPGMPSTWDSYISVENVDALVEKVTALGGTVIAPPMDVFEEGRMMVAQDPTGAFISFWQAKNHIGSGLVNVPGAFTWNELATRDVDKAKAFYGELLGWRFESGNQPGYAFIYNGDRMNGGIIEMDAVWGDLPPHWMAYFAVKDIEESVKKVQELGGRISVEITDIPGTGRFAVINDPQGAALTIMESTNPQPWTE